MLLNNHNISLAKPVMIAAALVAVLLLAACGGSDAKNPLELVPARANLIASADLPTILNDTDVATGYGLLAANDAEIPQTLAALLAEAESTIGIDLTSVGVAVLFADVSDGLGYAGFIASGDFDRDEIFAAVRAANTDETSVEVSYNDVVMLVIDADADDDRDDKASAVVAGAFVVGTVDAVRDVIDVAGGAAAVGGDLLAFYEGLGDVWAKVAVGLPAGIIDDLGDTSALGLPIDLGSLLEVELLGVVGDKDGGDAVVRIVAEYPTDALATETAETIDALLTLLPNLMGDSSLGELTDALSVTSTGTQVTLEFRSSVQDALNDLETAVDTLGGAAGFGL